MWTCTTPNKEQRDSKTFSCLLGNKGCHSYSGNPRGNTGTEDLGEASLTTATLSLIKDNVDESVGFISIDVAGSDVMNCPCGTGFRVGEKYLMTAYHVLEDKIEQIMDRISYEIEGRYGEDVFRTLTKQLEIQAERNTSETLFVAVGRVLRSFMEITASDIPLLLRRLKDIVDTETMSAICSPWAQKCVVNFVKHGAFIIDWKLILFGHKDSDIMIVTLLETQKGQTFPSPVTLDENYRQQNDFHIIRYIHTNPARVTIDQDTRVYKNDEDLKRDVDVAIKWWETACPVKKEDYYRTQYSACTKAHDEDTGRVILRASKSFTNGSSGSPVVYLFNTSGIPVVGLIYQRGLPKFYYAAQDYRNEEFKLFNGIEVDSKCFFEVGTTMKRTASLLQKYGKTDLKYDIFRQGREYNTGRYEELRMAVSRMSEELKLLQQKQIENKEPERHLIEQAEYILPAKQTDCEEREGPRQDLTAKDLRADIDSQQRYAQQLSAQQSDHEKNEDSTAELIKREQFAAIERQQEILKQRYAQQLAEQQREIQAMQSAEQPKRSMIIEINAARVQRRRRRMHNPNGCVLS